MIILEIQQGRYTDLAGLAKADAVTQFAAHDAAYCAAHPESAKYYQPPWRELDVPDTATARWGTEWYAVDAAGLLKRHSAHYDSSG